MSSGFARFQKRVLRIPERSHWDRSPGARPVRLHVHWIRRVCWAVACEHSLSHRQVPSIVGDKHVCLLEVQDAFTRYGTLATTYKMQPGTQDGWRYRCTPSSTTHR